MKKRIMLLMAALVVVSFASVAVCAIEKSKSEKKNPKEDLYSQVELFSDAIGVIRDGYVDDVDPKKLIYGALKGMLGSLDDYSQFMEPDEYNEIKVETKGEFGGVGIEISGRKGILTVIAPIAGTPAEAAGLEPQDKILKIDGEITKDMSLSDSVKKMRGKPGTTVVLTIWREKEDKIFDVPIKRAIIKIKSIKNAVILEPGIGYIRLAEFQQNTPAELENALKGLEKDKMDALVFDLRNNPGGLLDVAVDVAEKFLPKDTVIVSIKSKDPAKDVVFKSRIKNGRIGFPMVVLVNEGSASASEIVAGAIQDNKRGLVVGQKTYGKASVQTVMGLKDGSALRLTTASYLTPDGNIIRDHGIIPDIVVEKEAGKPAVEEDLFEKLEKKEKIDKELKKDKAPAEIEEKVERDSQLDRAVDILKALKIYEEDRR